MSRKLPWIEVEPIVGNLDLIPIHNLLLEDTVSVSQSIAPSWVVEGSHAVQEAGCETTKTSVAERGVVLLGDDIFDSEAEIGQASYKVSVLDAGRVSGYNPPFATSFIPTLSMALSNARPIKNSRDRSGVI